MINIGIIGCGKITQVRHAPEYYMNPNAKIIGFYDTNKERAEQLAREYNAVAYSSYEKMLENNEIDAVSVCSANQYHAQMTIAALKAGKHVLCEKPMAMSLAECEAMVQAAKESGKFLMIGHNQRLLKTHKRAKKLILEGAIGDIVTFKTTFAHGGPETWSIEPGKGVWFFSKEKAVLGAMADLGIHKTDLILYLTGQEIVETTAYLGTNDKKDANGNLIEVDDNAICIYKLSGGAVGTMSASWTCYGDEDNSTIIYGTKGVLKIFCSSEHSIVLERSDGEKIYYDVDKIQTNDNQTKSGVIDMFIESIITNTKSEIDCEYALLSMKAIFASVESAETGKNIQIK